MKTKKKEHKQTTKIDCAEYKNSGSSHLPKVPVPLKLNGKRTIVPKVPTTDYIPSLEMQTEGLFAGYKPLFLGNHVLPVKKQLPEELKALNFIIPKISRINLFSSNAVETLNPDHVSPLDNDGVKTIDIKNILKRSDAEVHPSDNIDNTVAKKTETLTRKPVIPWDASISGVIYNDHPFKNVPGRIISELKPFKIMKGKHIKSGHENVLKNEKIKLRVHARISDESELINIYDINHSLKISNQRKQIHNLGTSKKRYIQSIMSYNVWIKNLISKHTILQKDQRSLKNDIQTLNSFLADEFYKLTKLTIYSDIKEVQLPLYIYVSSTISSKRAFNRFLKKRIFDEIGPIYSTVRSALQDKEDVSKFDEKLRRNIVGIVNDIKQFLPSTKFYNEGVACIEASSPVPGFKRIYWLSRTKRFNTFWGKNYDKDFVVNYTGEFSASRNGIRYMSYPVNLVSSTFDTVFSEWKN